VAGEGEVPVGEGIQTDPGGDLGGGIGGGNSTAVEVMNRKGRGGEGGTWPISSPCHQWKLWQGKVLRVA
jgi:hypothetical protein